MRVVLIIIGLLICQISFGQFAIVSDTDGFVYVRKTGQIADNIIDTLENRQIVFCLEGDDENWRPVDYEKNGKTLSGYIHNSRLFYLDKYKEIKYANLTKESVSFKYDTITLEISKKQFDPKKNKLQYEKDQNIFLEKINGKPIWGTDGEIPKFQYKQMLLQLGKIKIELPQENLFEPSLENARVYLDNNTKTIYITADNSDGAGGYTVLWIIEDNKFLRQIKTIPF